MRVQDPGPAQAPGHEEGAGDGSWKAPGEHGGENNTWEHPGQTKPPARRAEQ